MLTAFSVAALVCEREVLTERPAAPSSATEVSAGALGCPPDSAIDSALSRPLMAAPRLALAAGGDAIATAELASSGGVGLIAVAMMAWSGAATASAGAIAGVKLGRVSYMGWVFAEMLSG